MQPEVRMKIAKASSVVGIFFLITSSSIFYGLFGGVTTAKYLLGLSEDSSMLFGFLPVTLACFVWMAFRWRKFAKPLKLERWIND